MIADMPTWSRRLTGGGAAAGGGASILALLGLEPVNAVPLALFCALPRSKPPAA